MEKKAKPMIWFNFGTGFMEEEKQEVSVTEGEAGRISFTVLVPKEATGLRIIPADFQCLAMISRLYLTGEIKRLLTYTTNGVKVANHTTAFVNADPYFEVDIKDCEERTIYVEMLIDPVVGEVLVDLIEGDLVNLNFQLQNARRDFDTIINSMCWKITKPLRIAMDLLKRKEKRERIQQEQIRFFALLVSDGKDTTNILHTIRSLKEQSYQKWNLSIFINEAGKTNLEEAMKSQSLTDNRISLEITPSYEHFEERSNAMIQASKASYLVFLKPGDYLGAEALSKIADTVLEKNADFIYTDEDVYEDLPSGSYWPNYKPDFAPDTLRGQNYIGDFFVVNKSLLLKVGGMMAEYGSDYHYDVILRTTEKASKIVHIPGVFLFKKIGKEPTVPASPALEKKALQAHLDRLGLSGEVMPAKEPSSHRVRYTVKGNPLVSILIPNKDHVEDLKKCIDSIFNKSTYRNFEIIIIENNSEKQETFAYYEELAKQEEISVVTWDKGFNYSAINNFGFSYAKGDYILLLNNDVEVITKDWLEEMLGFAQRKDVGAVGALLYYPDDTIQHAGAVYGICGLVGHVYKNNPKDSSGYYHRLLTAQNYSCVTAACLMVRRDVFEACQGLDERFEVAFNDIDFCLRIRKLGYLIVMTPFARLYHYESKSRGAEDSSEKLARFHREIALFRGNWNTELLEGDPYYNKNLTVHRDDMFFKS